MVAITDQSAQMTTVYHLVGVVGVAETLGQYLIKDYSTNTCADRSLTLRGHGDHVYCGMQVDYTQFISQHCFIRRGKPLSFALGTRAAERQVVTPEDHVQRWRNGRLAIGGKKHVMSRQHHFESFITRGFRQWHVYGHLIAVEVGAEGRANERMYLNRATFFQDWHEGLDTQAVQRRRSIQQNRMPINHLFENVPDLRPDALDDALGALDIVCESLVDEPAHHEWLEEL